MAQGDKITRRVNKKLMRSTTKTMNSQIFKDTKEFKKINKLGAQVLPWVSKYMGIEDKDQFIKMLRAINNPKEFDDIT